MPCDGHPIISRILITAPSFIKFECKMHLVILVTCMRHLMQFDAKFWVLEEVIFWSRLKILEQVTYLDK